MAYLKKELLLKDLAELKQKIAFEQVVAQNELFQLIIEVVRRENQHLRNQLSYTQSMKMKPKV